MVNIVFKDEAFNYLEEMDDAILEKFNKHFSKLSRIPSGRHLTHGLNHSVDNVGQGRIIYTVEKDTIYIIRCFLNHKDYEKW